MTHEIIGSILSAIAAIATAVAVYLMIQRLRRKSPYHARAHMDPAKLHDVYWGTHGCHRRKGHLKPCICVCKQTLPTGHQYVFGDDKDTAVFDPFRKVSQ